MYVFDATPLIYLAKAGRLELLDALDRECRMPEVVYEEVVTKGVEEGYADARRVERAVEDDMLGVVGVTESDVFDRLRRNPNLGEADAAVLAVAADHDATAVIDETYGRDAADVEDITTRGTAYLVLRLLERGTIDAGTARETIDEMVDAGWYLAPDLYAKVVRRIEDLS